MICASINMNAQGEVLFEKDSYKFPYNLNEAKEEFNLEEALVEISGLSYLNKSTLLAVQDEKGIIYHISLKNGKIKEKVKFDKSGDFEGIELVNDDVWALESNGDLFRINKKSKAKKYDTFLKSANDTEGLGYDPVNEQLLIACKGLAFKDKKNKHLKSIYAFDLESKKLLKEPKILIHLDTIAQYLKSNSMGNAGRKLLSLLNRKNKDLHFKPSGIAVHPTTGNYYVLGAVGHLLLVISPDNEILAVVKLKTSKFPQAEGICFSPKGTLYIANEGDNEDATLQVFKLKKGIKE